MKYADTSGVNIELRLIQTDSDRNLAKSIVENYHSYVPTYKSVGRRIDWFVVVNGEIKGMIGIGSSTYPPCKDMLKHLDISKNEYKEIFNNIANNWRFCMAEQIPNISSKILKCLRKEAQKEWKLKYGDELKYLLTFVGGGHDGACYKADNWEVIGQTAGLPSHKAVSMKWDSKSGTNTINEKFVKPTGENRKIIFFKKLN